MSPDESAFLRAIDAAPGDDAPRLVFADWLDEQGRGREAARLREQAAARRRDAALWIHDEWGPLTSGTGGRLFIYRYRVEPHDGAPELSAPEAAATVASFAPLRAGGLRRAGMATTLIAPRLWLVAVTYAADEKTLDS